MKSKYGFIYFSKFVILLLSCVILASCSSVKRVLMSPKYSNEEYSKNDLKREGVKVVKVYDKRSDIEKIDSLTIGNGIVGDFGKEVPYQIRGKLTNFVEKSVNKMICTDSSMKEFVPVTIIIDTFKVTEEAHLVNDEGIFKASINFSYPISKDSMGLVNTYTIQQVFAGDHISNDIENRIYLGMRKITEQFIEYYDNHSKLKVKSDSIPPSFTKEREIPKDIKEKSYKKNSEPEITSTGGLGLSYCSGDKIRTGVTVNYINFLKSKNSQFVNGLGYGIRVFDVENKKDGYQGNFVAFGGKFMPRFYFSSSNEGFYFGLGITLSGGTEKIGNSDNFFFGPTVEETLGVKLGFLYLEGGLYQLAHFGSKLLPNDTGFILGLGFHFK